jgi:hypothetical protein
MPGARVFTIEQGRSEQVSCYPTGGQTHGREELTFLQEKAARTKEVLASIGRGLRGQYNAPLPPLSERLAELVRKIEQATNE